MSCYSIFEDAHSYSMTVGSVAMGPGLFKGRIGAIGPPRKIGKILTFFGFFRPTQKMGPDGPKWGQEDFFLLIQTFPTFWAEWILILRILIFWIFLGSQISGLGPTWAHLGPTWAHPLGPHVGPPTLGPTWAHPLWAPRHALQRASP